MTPPQQHNDASRNEPSRATSDAQGDVQHGAQPPPGTIPPMQQHAEEKLRGGRLRRSLRVVRRRKKFAAGLSLVLTFYLVAVLADFLAPYDYRAQSRREPFAPPSVIRFRDAEGQTSLRPFVYARRLVDPLQRRYVEDTARAYPLAFFTRGYTYKLFGIITTDRHLFGVRTGASETTATGVDGRNAVGAASDVTRVHLFGTDALGRDRLSRLLVASRFSLVVGPLGTLLACALGVFLGCLAGYMGRMADALLMRVADTMLALPTLVVILAARAAFPLELPPMRAAALLITIFTLVGWAEMARVARGLVLGLRRREFVSAAVSLGLSQTRVLFRHILPNAARPLLVQATLMLPAFLLAEISLSFLGVGLQEPEPSWGNMLAAASDITLLQRGNATVLLLPAFAIILFVLGVRLTSDGLKETR
ncbi:MAG TPA: ABC transporter permease subunit [Pyrinomonadaceae bacterium]|jgi:peptide/nickel transport system permease protein